MWPLVALFVLSVARESYSIFGGTPAKIEDHPYEVLVEDVQWGESTCVGSIVSEYFIVTSAACAFYIDKGNHKKEAFIRAGSNVVGRDGTIHKIDRVIIHDKWSVRGSNNNIAVVRVKEPFQYQARIKPIEMFNKGETVKTGTIATVSGLGDSNIGKQLKALNVTVFDYKTCDKMRKMPELDETVVMCAKNMDKKGVKALSEDNDGSPLVIKGRLAGASSYVLPPHDGDDPTIYISVSAYRDWIDKQVLFGGQIPHTDL